MDGEHASTRPRPPATGRAQALAAVALLMVYLATMSGHMTSMDGLLLHRQAHAIAIDRSIALRSPARNWTGELAWNSQYGIGQSLLYVPGELFASPLASTVPVSTARPRNAATFYFQELYDDALYTVGASWVHAVIAAVGAWAVAALAVELGAGLRASLWAMALFGIGSVWFPYAQGDFAQPLLGLCWTAALLAATRYRHGGGAAALSVAALATGYGILTRPFEGALLVPFALLVMLPEGRERRLRRALAPTLALGLASALAAAVTLFVNWARFGDPLSFGYTSHAGWVIPEPSTVAAVLVSPGRGLLWCFPAVLLAPAGALALLRSGQQRPLVAIVSLCTALLVSTTCWHVWWGGWAWGLRLFVPAIPLLAVLAAMALERIDPDRRRWTAGPLLVAGLVWALPCVLTDMLQGYGSMTNGPDGAWMPAAFPPYGAWRFLERIDIAKSIDTNGVDILWFRLLHAAGAAILVVPVLLLVAAAALAARSRRELLASERAAPTSLSDRG